MSTTPANDAVRVREAAQALVDAHPVRGHHIAALKAALAATERAAIQPAGDTAGKWRTLALQYDGHRMQAIWHLQAMLQDAAKHAPIAAEFLQAAPSSAPVAQAMPSQPGGKYEVFFNGAWKPASEEAYYCMSEKNRRIAQAMPAAPSEAVLRGLLTEFGNASFDCAEYDRDHAEVTYASLLAISTEKREAIVSYFRALQGKPEAQAGE